jgi:hypothetical protein
MPDPYFYKSGIFTIFANGAEVGDSESLITNDNYLTTIGGVSVVESFGEVRRRFQFSTGAMTKAQKDLFMEFIMTTITGRKEVFSFRDRYSIVRQVRLVDANIEFTTNGPLYWVAKVNLEEMI